jgi:protease IV
MKQRGGHVTNEDPGNAKDASAAPKKKRRFPWGLFALLGFVVAGLGTCAFSLLGGLPERVAARTVLELNLESPVLERASEGPLQLVLGGGGGTPLRDILEALERGASDDRVVGVVARIGGEGHGLAVAQELRDAIARFTASGRFAVAFSETFGEGAPGNGGYYLATAFDEIWLQPTGSVGFVGLAAEAPFFAGVFEKVGVQPQFSARGDFKTFKNQFTERAFTDAHEESLARILTSSQEQLVAGVVKARQLSTEQVTSVLARAPLFAPDALEAGLVDRLGYRDEAIARLDELAKGEAARLFASTYLERAGRRGGSGPVIAVVYATGSIVRGAGGIDPLGGGESLGVDTLRASLRAVTADSDVRALVLRIDSPGGSWPASDAMRREVARVRDGGLPVVASMGNVAGSGGYYLAMEADRILAQPGTLTGSIGVVAGKLIVRELFEKLGVTFGRIEASPRAGMFSGLRPFSEDELVLFERQLDRAYEDFVGKAAAARKMPHDDLERLARGRVWTGADALERGLVDELGGLHEAIARAKELAGISAETKVRVRVYPPPRRPLGALLALLERRPPENSDDGSMGASLSFDGVDAWLEAARALGLPASHGILEVPFALRRPGGL